MLALVGIIAVVLTIGAAHAQDYDYTFDLRRDCLQWGLNSTDMFGAPLCEVITVEPLTRDEALRRKLSYRAVGWGKHFPADEGGYFIAKSGEFIPQSWSVASPDDKFHRCTYPLNNYWSGPENRWKVLPNSGTADGLPPTRCFWRP